MSLRGDINRDVELTDRAQIPQVAELLLIIDSGNEQWFRVREVRRGFVMKGDMAADWDFAVYVTEVVPPADDTPGPDRPEQMELNASG